MKSFQWIILALLSGGLSFEFWRFWRDSASRAASSTRIIVWLAAAVAISLPNMIQALATLVGIDRGADLVLYLFVFAFLVTAFSFYTRTVLMQRQLTTLVRQYAISEAEFSTPPDAKGLRVVSPHVEAPRSA